MSEVRMSSTAGSEDLLTKLQVHAALEGTTSLTLNPSAIRYLISALRAKEDHIAGIRLAKEAKAAYESARDSATEGLDRLQFASANLHAARRRVERLERNYYTIATVGLIVGWAVSVALGGLA